QVVRKCHGHRDPECALRSARKVFDTEDSLVAADSRSDPGAQGLLAIKYPASAAGGAARLADVTVLSIELAVAHKSDARAKVIGPPDVLGMPRLQSHTSLVIVWVIHAGLPQQRR